MRKDGYIPELTPEQEKEISWMKNEVEFLPLPDWIYRVACFIMRKKKLTYQEVFMLIYGMNKHLGDKKAKEYALQKTIFIYEANNNNLPEGIEHGA